MQSKSEMLDELWEFFETFSVVLLAAKIDYDDVTDYTYARREFSSIRQVYTWVFTKFFKVVQVANRFHKLSRTVQVNMEVTRSIEYIDYTKQLKIIGEEWSKRPCK